MADVLTEITVRRALAADADRLSAIWQEAAEALSRFDPRHRLAPDGVARWRAALQSWLGRDDMAVFVAECEGRVLGYIVGALAANLPGLLPERCGYVSDMAVDFHAKTGHIGRDLLEALKGWFREAGVEHVEARVPSAQPVAQAFWRALGAGKLYEQMWLKLD